MVADVEIDVPNLRAFRCRRDRGFVDASIPVGLSELGRNARKRKELTVVMRDDAVTGTDRVAHVDVGRARVEKLVVRRR